VPYYDVVEIKGQRSSDYETLYFDTPDFSFYRQHHNGKLNRYKVRYRKYVNTNDTFLEVKFKSNKGRTIKERIRETAIHSVLQNDSKEFIARHLPAHELDAKLWVYYTRITFVSKAKTERVTIDLGLNYKANDKTIGLPCTVIAEVKQDKATGTSHFMRVMHQHRILPMSYSKYCVGALLLNTHLKYNRFKEKLLSLKQLNNDLPAWH
jgi:hypothetical protein